MNNFNNLPIQPDLFKLYTLPFTVQLRGEGHRQDPDLYC